MPASALSGALHKAFLQHCMLSIVPNLTFLSVPFAAMLRFCLPCTALHALDWCSPLKVVRSELPALQCLATRAEQLSSVTPRNVPISWYGIGQEVRVMGSFDGWATGVLLSAEQLQDDVFNCYTGILRLTPVR